MRQSAIVAGRLHAVMGAQRLVTAGLILARLLVEIAESGRQAVAAMLQRCSAEPPQGILQSLGQGHEALATEDDMAMFPAREGQPKMIEPVIERHTSDADAEIAHVGEIRQPQSARRVILAKDDVAVIAVQRPPGADATLKGAADAWADLRVTATDLVKNGDRSQAGSTLQQRHDLAVPDRGQRIPPPAAAWRPLLGWQPMVVLDAICGRGAEPGPGRGDDGRLSLSKLHVEPHLAVGDVAARQGAVPHRREEPSPYPAGHDCQTRAPSRRSRRRWVRDYGRATPSLRHKPSGAFSS